MKCLDCNNLDIKYWCLDRFCEKNLICEQCQFRHGEVEKLIFKDNQINMKFKIEIEQKKMMKNLVTIICKIYQNTQNMIEKLNEKGNEQNRINLLKQQCKIYGNFFQIKPKIENCIINLNNELKDFNQIKIQNINDPEYITQINSCKKLIQEKEFIKASQLTQSLNFDDYGYFQIECLILQKKFNDALELTDQTLKNLESNLDKDINLYNNLLLQKAKILHKQKEYYKALKVLKEINIQQWDDEYKLRRELQMAKTYLKCGQIEFGQKQIMKINKQKNSLEINSKIQDQDKSQKKLDDEFLDLKKKIKQSQSQNGQPQEEIQKSEKEYLEKHQKKKYIFDNFSFSLTLAKANLFNIDGIAVNSNDLDSLVLSQEKNKITIIQNIQEIYKNILKEEPTNQKALFGLGQTYLKKGEYLEAREIFYQLYQLNPQNRKAQIGLIFIKKKLKEQKNGDQQSNQEGCLSCLQKTCC